MPTRRWKCAISRAGPCISWPALGQFHHDLDIVGNAAGDENLLATDPLVPEIFAGHGGDF